MLTLDDLRRFLKGEVTVRAAAPATDVARRRIGPPSKLTPPAGAGTGSAPETGEFARRLMTIAGFGDSTPWGREKVLLGLEPGEIAVLPPRVDVFSRSAARPFSLVVIESTTPASKQLGRSLFRKLQGENDLESALERICQSALRGFAHAGGTASLAARGPGIPVGKQTETVVVASIRDDRFDEDVEPDKRTPAHLMMFATRIGTDDQIKAGEGLETFVVRQECARWEPQLFEEYTERVYKRHFERLAKPGPEWREAFVIEEERKKARALLKAATNPREQLRLLGGPSGFEKKLQETCVALMEEVAKGFGLQAKDGKLLECLNLPKAHDIAADPASRDRGEDNPLPGLIVRDQSKRLLGYIVYCLDSAVAVEVLRERLQRDNCFHNVLVIFPDLNGPHFELWQGTDRLDGLLVQRGAKLGADATLVSLLTRFFVVGRNRVANPQELAEELAKRARFLRRLAARQLRDEESETLPEKRQLTALLDAFRAGLIHSMTAEEFADAYAQTMAYGLLSARWISKDELSADAGRTRKAGAPVPQFTRIYAQEHLSSTSPFLKALFEKVLSEKFEPKLAWLLDDVAALLNQISVDQVFESEKVTTEVSADPVIHFYEPFLAAYDRDTKNDRGVFYTPDAVVRYMIRQADSATLATTGERLVDGNLRVLDPSTGTGTFLCELVRYAQAAGVDESGLARLIGNLRGLELMVAPYVMCHLRLSLLTRGSPGSATGGPVKVHLTNTLELPVAPPRELFESERPLALEAVAANEVKGERVWTLVIGNPPYKNNSSMTLAQVSDRFPELLASSRDAAAAKTRNIRDDYAWFFAAAESFMQGGGVLSFVTSDSYLRKFSYRYFRRELIARYRIVSITRLGAGVFANVGPRIGFAIIVMVRRATPVDPITDKDTFDLLDISNTAVGMPGGDHGTARDPRLVWLDAEARAQGTSTEPANPGVRKWRVRPADTQDFRFLPPDGSSARRRPPSLQVVAKKDSHYGSVFLKKWPGIITAFDTLLKGETAEALGQRMRDFLSAAKAGDAEGVTRIGVECDCNEGELLRLRHVAGQVRHLDLSFQPERVKPVFGGTIPNGRAWHPPLTHAHWIYYEPRIKIPRNVNPGKDAGWGSMEQWRDPRTHEGFPKLIFTTSANKNYGFRAFVVEAGWYTKLHGAASQQFHYVTLSDPTRDPLLGGGYNNLAPAGTAALALLRRWEMRDEDLLHLIAAIYNSRYAASTVTAEEDSMLPLPSFDEDDEATVRKLVGIARRLRELSAAREAALGGRAGTQFPLAAFDGAPATAVDIASAIAEQEGALNAVVDDLLGTAIEEEEDE